jgi:tetratricopeptide (TPR) repeat protein
MTSRSDPRPRGAAATGSRVVKPASFRRWGIWLAAGLLALAIPPVVVCVLDRPGRPGGAGGQAELRPAALKPASSPNGAQGRQRLSDSHSSVPRDPSAATSPGDGGVAVEAEPPATVEAANQEMRQLAQKVLGDFPNQPRALEIPARLYMRLGQTAKAAEYWKQCLALDAGCSRAYYDLATIAAKKGDRQEAVSLMRKALAIAPDAVPVQLELAKLLIDLRQFPRAIEVLREHVRVQPRSGCGYLLLGLALLQNDAPQEARQAYQSAIGIDPQDFFAYLGLANACARLGQTEQAKQYRAKFRQLQPAGMQGVLSARGRFDDMASSRNALAEVCTSAAPLYHARGNLAETERLCRRAAQVAPRDVESRMSLVWLYRRSGRTLEAIGMLEQLARIQPSAALYPAEIGRLYATLGEHDKARQWLQQARQIQATR